MAIAISATSVVIAGVPGILRTGIEMVLAAETWISVDGAVDGAEPAVRAVRMHHPAVVVVDLEECAELDGYAPLVASLRTASPVTAVVAMVGKADPIVVRDLLRAEAGGCITRTTRPETLVEAVRRVADGERYVEPRIAIALANVTTRNGDGELTPREYEILRLVAMGHTNREVANRLFLSVRTIESHRARLQLKLGVDRRSDLVRAARDLGLAG